MKGVTVGVAIVTAALYLVGLGGAPFVDPPEGFHAAIAREMAASGDWVMPRLGGVRYVDKPPLLYWLLTGSFALWGTTPFAGRLWAALAAVGCAAVTARIGAILGGPRLGLIAGLMVATNLGLFLYGRLVKTDVLFVLWVLLALAGFTLRYLGRGRWALVVFYASLGVAALTKDALGAVGPLVVVALFLWLTSERPLAPWFPWWGILITLTIAVPWYLTVESRSPGFLWYTIVDNHVLNLARHRFFPDEDVPLGAFEFLAVTAAAFLPWALAAPFGVARALRQPRPDSRSRVWAFLALWAVAVIGIFAVSPFKLPHYGLPAFPALALLVARVWEETIDRSPGSPSPRALLIPVLVVFTAAAFGLLALASGLVHLSQAGLATVDVATRTLAGRGQSLPEPPMDIWRPLLEKAAVVFVVATAATAFAVWRRSAALGLGVALATMIAFLPVAGEGMAQYARGRSIRPVTEALVSRWRPGDVVIHEGPLEDSGSLLLTVGPVVRVVNGLQANLAFGATFPETRDVFWDAARLRAEWQGQGRRFLVSVVAPERSVVAGLPPGSAPLIVQSGGRWLYSNLAD